MNESWILGEKASKTRQRDQSRFVHARPGPGGFYDQLSMVIDNSPQPGDDDIIEGGPRNKRSPPASRGSAASRERLQTS